MVHNMVFDTHCHVHLYPGHFSEKMAKIYMGALAGVPVWWDPDRTWVAEDLNTDPAKLIADMDRAGIERAFLLSQYWGPFDTHTPSEYVAEVIAQYPDRFIGFHGGDPIAGLKSVKELEHAVKEYGFRGLKLSPAYNHVAVNDPRIYPLYCKCEELGIPALVHAGWTFVPGSRIENQNPLLFDEVAETFPTLKLIVAHTGFHWSHETVMLMRKHKNVYADLAFWESSMPFHFIAESLMWAKATGVLDRIFWGSDYPSADPAESIALYRRVPKYTQERGLDPVITEEDIEGVLGGNARKLVESLQP
ncbi:MAG TPA: amidohydrolase family protein [Chloroflexia bacterium]|nr:amidohydrolase family protein [Chloroflexia bacterium]